MCTAEANTAEAPYHCCDSRLFLSLFCVSRQCFWASVWVPLLHVPGKACCLLLVA